MEKDCFDLEQAYLDLITFKLNNIVWNNQEELWRKWIRL